jgi:arginase
MGVCLIQVPYMAGDDRHGSSRGPKRLLEAGASRVLAARGIRVTLETIDRGEPFRDTAASAARVNKQLAAVVRKAVDAGQFPIALAGSCNSSLGVVAGFDHAGCGAVWLDAHADFNTPESTLSGFFPGMSLAVISGHCYRQYWAEIGDSTPIAEDAIVMYGVRDLRPEAERERLERSGIQVVEWRDGKPSGDLVAPLERLARRVQEIYLHIDFDGFGPEVAPGIVDEPVPGGLSFEDAEGIMRAAAERFRIRAATLATYTPELDKEERTLRVGLRIIELLGELTQQSR